MLARHGREFLKEIRHLVEGLLRAIKVLRVCNFDTEVLS